MALDLSTIQTIVGWCLGLMGGIIAFRIALEVAGWALSKLGEFLRAK